MYQERQLDTTFGPMTLVMTDGGHVCIRPYDPDASGSCKQGLVTVNRVKYNMTLHLYRDAGWGVRKPYHDLYLQRSDYANRSTEAARKKILDKLVPEIAKHLGGQSAALDLAVAAEEEANRRYQELAKSVGDLEQKLADEKAARSRALKDWAKAQCRVDDLKQEGGATTEEAPAGAQA